MFELQIEDITADQTFQDNLRHRIVANCQQLRLSLILINKLMSLYNDAVTAGKINPSVN